MPITNPLASVQSPTKAASGGGDLEEKGVPDPSSIPRTVAGVVNEKGDIVDKAGKVIGNVGDVKDHEKLIGSTVTEKGDIVSDLGDKLAQVHIEDNYTPTKVPEADKDSSGGWNVLGKARSAMSVGENLKSAVNYGQNLQGAYTKFTGGQKVEDDKTGNVADTAQDKVGDAKKAGEDTAGDVKNKAEDAKDSAGDQVPDPVKMEDRDANAQSETTDVEPPSTTGQQDTVTQSPQPMSERGAEQIPGSEGAALGEQNEAGEEQTQDATTAAEGLTGDAGDKLDETKDTADDQVEAGKDAAGDQTEEAKAAAEDGGDKLDETKDAAGDQAEAGVDEAGDKLDETKEGVTGDEAGDKVEGVTGEDAGDKLDETKDAVGDQAEAGVDEAGEKIEGAEDAAGEAGDKVEGQGEDVEGVTGEAGDKVDETKEEAEAGAEAAGEEAEKPLDFSVLKGGKVNKAGNVVNDKGDIIGRLIEGDAKQLLGKFVDGEGQIWDDSGKVVGKVEPLSDAELKEQAKDFAPFENFPDAIVEADGRVMFEGKQVGTVVEGDPKRLKGSKVDEDGDILDRRGNTIGKAEPYDEPEEEPEAAIDMSILAGKRVNKAGNVVDSNGQIFGRVIEGNVKSLVGRMCDKEGNIMSESGEKVGKAELVSESEREGSREGPFAELSGLTVSKDGKVVTPAGDVVGRLVSGDAKALAGRSVDEDGDVLDKNGNSLGKAERWEEPEVEKKKDPMAGRKVNREGNVVDEDGNVIGKLVSGDLNICSGKEVDDDGDVVNAKGNTIGHVSLLEDIPPEPEEPAEEKEAREQAEKDRKLAGQLAGSIEQSLEKIRPILRMITDKVDKAERTPKEELDEEALVKEVKPLIEEGNKILTEANGVVRGMDPDGRIQRNAKHKSGTKDASPEEHHLAEMLKELTGDVTQTIDNAKRKIEDMPHAKKELNPLWGLLSEPLFQIVAAVGLLLNGVLSLVGQLLSGLGLGGLVDGILGGLGLNKVLDGLGLGSVTGALSGKKKDKDSK